MSDAEGGGGAGASGSVNFMKAFVPGLILGFVVGAVVGVVAPEFRSTPQGVTGTGDRPAAQTGEREARDRDMRERAEDLVDDAEGALDGMRRDEDPGDEGP